MGDLPSDIPEPLVIKIRIRLLRLHSRKLDGEQVAVCFREAYDAFASELRSGGVKLTEIMRHETIPGWVYNWAVARAWIAYPLIRKITGPLRILGDNGPSHELIPGTELVATLGEYAVTPEHKQSILLTLESRTVFWEAEALVEAPQNQHHEQSADPSSQPPSIATQISDLRLECDMTVEALAEQMDINPGTISRHLSGKAVPQNRLLTRYMRIFSTALKRKVVITQTPAKASKRQ